MYEFTNIEHHHRKGGETRTNNNFSFFFSLQQEVILDCIKAIRDDKKKNENEDAIKTL
jgi:hypothetical protein